MSTVQRSVLDEWMKKVVKLPHPLKSSLAGSSYMSYMSNMYVIYVCSPVSIHWNPHLQLPCWCRRLLWCTSCPVQDALIRIGQFMSSCTSCMSTSTSASVNTNTRRKMQTWPTKCLSSCCATLVQTSPLLHFLPDASCTGSPAGQSTERHKFSDWGADSRNLHRIPREGSQIPPLFRPSLCWTKSLKNVFRK